MNRAIIRQLAALGGTRFGVLVVVAALALLLPSFSNGDALAAGVGPQSVTFSCLGLTQYFNVPPGVTEISVHAAGAAGASSSWSGNPGKGGTIDATLAVTPGHTLAINVGCQSGFGYANGGSGGATSLGSHTDPTAGLNGGGATGIVDEASAAPLLVAAGGGGAGGTGVISLYPGGNGADGNTDNSTGGTGLGSAGGGSLGASGTPAGAAGGDAASGSAAGGGGGGGGGDAHGGGGGGGGDAGGGGGGGGGAGNSFTDPGFVSGATFGVAASAGDGQVAFSYTGPDGVPQVFSCTGSLTTYTVPDGVTGLLVTAIGGVGASSPDAFGGGAGGHNAGLSASVQVTAGEALTVGVGCQGGGPGAGGEFDNGNPGGGGGFGIRSGGHGGSGDKPPLVLSIAAGGGGGGGATGMTRAGTIIFAAAGGGGGGGHSDVSFGACLGGNGGDADISGGTAGNCTNPGGGGGLGAAGNGSGDGGSGASYSSAGGGGGGGGGCQNGGGGGGGDVGEGGGGGGGGGVSCTNDGVTNVTTFLSSSYGGANGILLVSPIFETRVASTTTVTVPVGAVYDGTAKVATAVTTGTGGVVIANPTVSYSPGPGAPVDAGTYQASASFPGNDQYFASSDSESFTIAKAASTTVVTAPSVPYDGHRHGATAEATGAGGLVQSLSVTYAGRNGTSYGPSTTAPTNAGEYTASASYGGDANHNASSNSANFRIDPARLTVTAKDASRLYGAANPTFTATYTGFVNGETPSVLSGTLTLTTSATAASPVGDYNIVPGGLTSTNYDITFIKGILHVTPASLSVTADDASRVYGAANPSFTGSLTGVVNGDNITASFTTTATGSSAVGTYPITPVLNDPDHKLGNYSVSRTNGTLTVTQANLTVTAHDASRLYGAANPPLTGDLVGVVNHDDITASYSTTATTASPVGDYPIVPTLHDPNNRLGNYQVTSTNGTLEVNKAPLTVTANDKTRVYGDPNPVFDAVADGLVNDDTLSGIGITCSSSATESSPVGTYDIVCSGDPTNYRVVFNAGTLTVTKAPTGTAITSKTALALDANGQVTVDARLTWHDGADPLAGKTITFSAGGVSATGTTNADGLASVTLTLPSDEYTLTASFAGDSNFLPSDAAAQTLIVFQSSQFVIWGGNQPTLDAAIQLGQDYTFWGAQWAKQVAAGDYPANADFEGYANSLSADGTGWSTAPGNSSGPPATLPPYIGVIVTTHVQQNGATISGNIAEIVVVKVDDPASYLPDPGHPASGVVVAIAP